MPHLLKLNLPHAKFAAFAAVAVCLVLNARFAEADQLPQEPAEKSTLNVAICAVCRFQQTGNEQFAKMAAHCGLSWLGFDHSGIRKGSWAARWQSYLGKVPKSGAFPFLQRIGMKGMAAINSPYVIIPELVLTWVVCPNYCPMAE